jgi:hypothetical protein
VKLVGRVDRTGTLQQVEWRGLRVAGRLTTIIFRRVLVRRTGFCTTARAPARALATGQFLGGGDLQRHGTFLSMAFSASWRIGRCLLKRPAG